LDEKLTKLLEEKMDKIERGEVKAQEAIKEFFTEVREIMKSSA